MAVTRTQRTVSRHLNPTVNRPPTPLLVLSSSRLASGRPAGRRARATVNATAGPATNRRRARGDGTGARCSGAGWGVGRVSACTARAYGLAMGLARVRYGAPFRASPHSTLRGGGDRTTRLSNEVRSKGRNGIGNGTRKPFPRLRTAPATSTAPCYRCKLSVLIRSRVFSYLPVRTSTDYGIVPWSADRCGPKTQRWGLTEKLVRARVVLSVFHVVAGWA